MPQKESSDHRPRAGDPVSATGQGTVQTISTSSGGGGYFGMERSPATPSTGELGPASVFLTTCFAQPSPPSRLDLIGPASTTPARSNGPAGFFCSEPGRPSKEQQAANHFRRQNGRWLPRGRAGRLPPPRRQPVWRSSSTQPAEVAPEKASPGFWCAGARQNGRVEPSRDPRLGKAVCRARGARAAPGRACRTPPG